MDDDVVWDIFTKLSPKSIVRFKSLSKRWNSHLSSRNFVKRHLQIGQTRKDFFTMTNEMLFLPFRIDDDECKFDDDGILKVKESIPLPWSENSIFVRVLMHCDGLLCLYTNAAGIFVVWNPLTKQHHEFRLPDRGLVLAVMGFGYDSIIDDYKIMCITKYNSILLLRLKEGVWNKIADKPPLPCTDPNIRSTFFNGCLYWIHRSRKGFTHDVILCFYLENEKIIKEIEISPNFFDKNTIFHHLDILEGSLCLVIDYQDRTDILTLKEGKYLVKLVTIPRVRYATQAALCCISGKDQVLVADSLWKLHLRSSKGFSSKQIMLKGVEFKSLFFVLPYIESLVLPNGNYPTSF